MDVYRKKKQLIEVVEYFADGSVLVQNMGNSEDRWTIPADVFLATYERQSL